MAEIITLDMESPSIQYLCKKDKRLAKVISMIGNISYEPHADAPFPFLIHEIVEQMLSIKAGAKIYDRLVYMCDGNVCPKAINELCIEDIRSTGTSYSKAQYIKGVAEATLNGEIEFENFPSMSDEEIFNALTNIRGIGNWTAKMYLIFVLDRQDILPYEDIAFLQGYKWIYKTDDVSKESVMRRCNKWKPYSSIAARYLYRALDMGLTKQEFHLYK